jgi:hypothetical protein
MITRYKLIQYLVAQHWKFLQSYPPLVALRELTDQWRDQWHEDDPTAWSQSDRKQTLTLSCQNNVSTNHTLPLRCLRKSTCIICQWSYVNKLAMNPSSMLALSYRAGSGSEKTNIFYFGSEKTVTQTHSRLKGIWKSRSDSYLRNMILIKYQTKSQIIPKLMEFADSGHTLLYKHLILNKNRIFDRCFFVW